jgi:hypothetical protein
MRQWIETLFYNASAHVDFLKYIDEISVDLKDRMYEALKEGKQDEASLRAFELAAYEGLSKTFKKETKEHQQQVEKEVSDARTNY